MEFKKKIVFLKGEQSLLELKTALKGKKTQSRDEGVEHKFTNLFVVRCC